MSSTITPGACLDSTGQQSSIPQPTSVDGPKTLQRDNGARKPTRFRAIQLNEFTNWLRQDRSARSGQIDRTSENCSPAELFENRNASIQENLHRIDAAADNSLNHHVAPPHFPTADYVAPEPQLAASIAAKIPTDGFDPSIDIERTIRQLKADGRVIGDLHQTVSPEDKCVSVLSFRWPAVTNSLLGSPAILNLETNIQDLLANNRNQILVTSTRPGDGASTVAISLARQLAAHGSKVLIVDADVSHPTLADRIGLQHNLSWVQVISNRRSVNQVIVTQKASPLSLLPLMPIAPRVGWPRKIYDELARISNRISRNYDVVVIDAGPVRQLIEESTVPRIRAATTLLVAGGGPASGLDLEIARSDLQSFGINEMLIVRNFSQVGSMENTKVG